MLRWFANKVQLTCCRRQGLSKPTKQHCIMGVGLENVGELNDGEAVAQMKREEGEEDPSGN